MFCALTALVVCRARRRDDHTVVRIGAFMPFATYDGGVPTETSGGVYKQVAVAAALAATQFNERNASVIEEFGSLGPCDRQLELSLFNTFGRSSDALMEYRNNYEHLDVIVGAANNEISEPLALYCEIDKRPQISFGSGSTALDKYEWFMRTIPSGGEFADRAMMFAMENNWNSIGVLYSENEGESYRESLSPKCVKFHFICKWAFFQSGSSASLDIAISNLVEFRIIFLAFSDADLALVSERLVANKVTTNEHAFVFMDLMSDEALIRATGDVAELVRGGFKMSVEAAYTTDDARLRLQATLKQQMVEDFTSLLDAVEPFGTLDADFFNRAFVFSQICFAFDAVATIGIASCNATPRGEELLAAMKGASFVGVSNVVEFAENGNRKADPLPLNIVNFIGNGTAGLTAICVATWNKDKWEVLDGQQYTFRDGSSTAPADSVVCQPGAYLDESGRCRECPAGKFQPNSGASTCAECLSSSYQDLTGQQGCKLCGENAAVGWEGSPSAKDCRCLAGYYTPTWPLSECHSCDRPSLQNKVVCEGGFTLPYPRDAYWLDVSNSATTKLRAYRCRHAFLCVGGTRPTACAKGYAEAHNGSCLRASGEPVKLGRPNRWCDAGHHFEEPLCEEPKDGRFAVATLAPKCPARVNHILFTILCYAVLFALFAVINDFIRPGYNVLNLVLAVFQDLGILTSFRLYWPKQFQYIIVLYRIALFDVDVLDPTCAFPKWGQAHTFFLTLALPFVHLVIRCAYAAVATSGGLNAWHSTIGSHASFVVTSMPILLMYCMSPFLCRRFVGREQRVFAVSPADSCDSSTANAMRVVASIYFAYVLMVCGICTYHVTVRLHRNELHNPEVLRVYGFLYKPYRSHALYWSSASPCFSL
ncbi:hypothetical protein CTAYLR_002192 [Chrysophaeum taylorii]|uniref:Receptor ligand binding region domain-containing protein n=1 Tax=Chrysophaeum taylorii TaxID=2483200 RepID=A0AAD7UP59_9STRA|nr:hypothetical protein CTAYLR_002192 [Chrysophaeum taylorii]